jgi:hypothetical protein
MAQTTIAYLEPRYAALESEIADALGQICADFGRQRPISKRAAEPSP